MSPLLKKKTFVLKQTVASYIDQSSNAETLMSACDTCVKQPGSHSATVWNG